MNIRTWRGPLDGSGCQPSQCKMQGGKHGQLLTGIDQRSKVRSIRLGNSRLEGVVWKERKEMWVTGPSLCTVCGGAYGAHKSYQGYRYTVDFREMGGTAACQSGIVTCGVPGCRASYIGSVNGCQNFPPLQEECIYGLDADSSSQ